MGFTKEEWRVVKAMRAKKGSKAKTVKAKSSASCKDVQLMRSQSHGPVIRIPVDVFDSLGGSGKVNVTIRKTRKK